MLKQLSYFFAAVLLMSLAKLLEIAFMSDYEPKKPKVAVESKIKESKKTGKTEAEKVDLAGNEEVELSKDSSLAQTPAEVQEVAPQQSTVTSQDQPNLEGEAYFQNLKNTYLSPIIAELPEGRSREDVVVRYYKHNMDNDRVYALRRLGYYLHEKEPEDSEDLESNVLYYGREVDIRDIQLVAYTLIKNGVPLRAIKQSQFDWKLSALEIGTDSLLQETPLLTLSSIESFDR